MSWQRWNTYQAERFPLVRHATLVTVTSACMLAFSAHARGVAPDWRWLLPAALVNVLAFFQLRVLDEFKDAEIDARYRPERPVPRGLVRLGELRTLGLIAAATQLALVLLLKGAALPLLLLCWAFMGLMTAEFFVPDWLKARPAAYLLSHQPIVPLLQLLASSWDWAGRGLPSISLLWLIVVSFGAGLSLEIGRKIYAPAQEREGVDTYTAAWGIPTALLAWGAGCSLTTWGAFLASSSGWRLLPLLVWAAALWGARHFNNQRTPKASALIESLSAGVVLLSYVTLAMG